jgi:hypothetical protein
VFLFGRACDVPEGIDRRRRLAAAGGQQVFGSPVLVNDRMYCLSEDSDCFSSRLR